MGLLSRKDPAEDRLKPHDYKAPPQPPSSGHVACLVCGRAPNDALHGAAKTGDDTDMHWS